MQYISDRLRYNTIVLDDSDYSSLFTELKDGLGEIEEVAGGISSPATSICINVIGEYSIGVGELLNIIDDDNAKDFENAIILMDELYDFVDGCTVDPNDMDLNDIPPKFRKFFSVKKSIEFVKSLKACREQKRRTGRKSKRRMLF